MCRGRNWGKYAKSPQNKGMTTGDRRSIEVVIAACIFDLHGHGKLKRGVELLPAAIRVLPRIGLPVVCLGGC